MKRAMIAASLSLAIPLVISTQAQADTKSSMREAKESIREATDVYKAMAQDPKNKVPKTVLDNAKCVAIFPNAVTVSLGIGGSHSDGVAFCKSSTGAWENPMFLDLVGGSIGVQAGVKSADVVMYITGDKARNDLKNGKFVVGGELSAVAGTFDETFRPSNAQIVAYTRTEGLFAGASVDGVNVSRDKDDEMAFYGTENPSMSAKLSAEAESAISALREALPANVG